MRFAWALMAAVMALAGAARSEPVEIGEVVQGPVYYNRPGATLVDHNAELDLCIHETATVNGLPKLGLPLLDTYLNYLIWDGPVAGLAAGRVENCMIVRGWRAVRLPPGVGAEIAALSTPDLTARLEPLVGSRTPDGEIVRAWGNEAEHPTGYKPASRPTPPSKDQLSLKLYAAVGGRPSPGPLPPLIPVKLDAQWPTKPLKPADVASAPSGAGLIVVRVMGISNRWGTGVGFRREGATPETQPSADDHAPDTLIAGTGTLFAKKEGNWFILAAPPGRWRVAGSGFVNYCLGGPSLEIKAGEVVYAGTFHLDGEDLGPDLDLGPAKVFLGDPGADKLRPAVYRNGARGSCQGVGAVYALEFPGAPFAPDYKRGGALAAP